MGGSGHIRRLRRQAAWRLLAVASLVVAALLAWIGAPASAASGFASPLFLTQWQAGEAVTPNFWGPLSLAREGQQEQYAEAPGGQRLVQYFDKARMELTNPASSTVTNGLLATELITGKLQTGDATFETRMPASVPIAGDPDNIGPTYASIAANSTTLLANTPTAPGTPVSRSLSATGTLGTFGGTDPQAVIAAYDADTQHNVPKAFSDYRTKVGLLSIGFAISEPFWSNVKVAGTQKDVLVQAFQRRILTYTPSNPAAFQVEFGNIGSHYYTWRYQIPVVTPTVAATATPSVTATPTIIADTTAPKFTSAPKVEYVTPYSFALSWTTNEPASSEAKYGDSSNYASINDKQKAFFTYDHYLVITGLQPSTTYHYRIQSRDPAGNLTADDQDRATNTPAANAIPSISNIAVTKPTSTTFTATWVTNAASSSRVEYGVGVTNGIAYDRYRKGDAGDPVGTGHAATAISMEPKKVYYFRVVALLPAVGDAPPLAGASDDPNQTPYPNNLVQTNSEANPLKINDLRADQDKGGQPTRISFATDRPASVIIEIGPTNKLGGGFVYGPMADYPYPFSRNLHTITIPLSAGTWYYRVAVYDETGTGTSEIKSFIVT